MRFTRHPILGQTSSFVKTILQMSPSVFAQRSCLSPCECPSIILLSLSMAATRDFKNILIIKPGAIGDLLLMTPVIRALKSKYPSATVSLMVGSVATAQLFRFNPSVRETIIFDKKGTHRSIHATAGLWRSLRQKKFDLIVNFQRSNFRAWFLASASFPCRVLVYHKSRSRNVHAVVNYLETLRPLGIPDSRLDLELIPGPDERAFAEKLLHGHGEQEKNGPLIALNPGASHAVNRWPSDHFAKLADLLSEELQAKVIVTGGNEDLRIAEEICANAQSKPLQLAGKLTLLQLAAVLERCNFVITGDTGPMHIATAVGTRVLALFGAADPVRTGPVGKGHMVLQASDVACLPCRSRACSSKAYLECMRKISPTTVCAAAGSMIGDNNV